MSMFKISVYKKIKNPHMEQFSESLLCTYIYPNLLFHQNNLLFIALNKQIVYKSNIHS